MPLNVRRFYAFSALGFLLVLVSFIGLTCAQTVAQNPQPPVQTTPQTAPTSGDVMRGRISKAKAFIAVRNYNAAIYELDNIRKESGDAVVLGVVNVLLMNSYLEQGDYKRAQDFLTQFYNQQKTSKANSSAWYMAVAGQVVKGARSRVERYRALGLSVSDRTLPIEATNDLEKMRETLEMVITQSKEIGNDKKKSADSMALLEEASNSRSMLARDEYDGRKWHDEVADTREKMANSRSTVLSAVDETQTTTQNTDLVAAGNKPAEKPLYKPVDNTPTVDNTPVVTREREVLQPNNGPSDTAVAKNDKPVYIPSAPPVVKDEPKTEKGGNATIKERAKTETGGNATVNEHAKSDSPLDVGSLIGYATKQPSPIYPPAARNVRAGGVVKVEVTVNEAGDVDEVQKASGPALLQGAAKDAIRKWKFRPFVRDGQPVKATGFVSFNFAM